MADSPRTYLKKAIVKRFVPLLESRGWVKQTRPPEFDSSEMRRSFPLGTFARESPVGFHLVDIQFDKRLKPEVRISIGTVPADGLPSATDGTQVPVNGLVAMNGSDAHFIRSTRYGSDWFGYCFWQRKDRAQAEKIVTKIISRWAEAEDYFDSGRTGRHLRKWR
jgi:hypothetical protein